MWTQGSWSFRFLSALALVLILAQFDRMVLDQAAPRSTNAYIAQEMAKWRIPDLFAAAARSGSLVKRKPYGVRGFNLRAHEEPIDRLPSVMRIRTGKARMGSAFAAINGEEVFGVRQGDCRRPGFLSGRLVRAIYGRFTGQSERREGNWN